MEGEVVIMQEIFALERRGIDEDGRVIAEIRATGVRPHFVEKLMLSGIRLGAGLFDG
jgi:pilus assembly protein CpaF